MTDQRILLIADPSDAVAVIDKHLRSTGYHISASNLPEETQLSKQLEEEPDLILIINKDEKAESFQQIIQFIRRKKLSIPILNLIQDQHYSARVESLQIGSDDVLSFPFAIGELDARIMSLLRRSSMGANHVDGTVLRHGDLELNTDTREILRGGVSTKLTVREYDLMLFFLNRPGQALARKSILHAVWGQSWTGDDNLLEVYIRYLRKKIERPDHDKLLQTVRGVGYILKQQKEPDEKAKGKKDTATTQNNDDNM